MFFLLKMMEDLVILLLDDEDAVCEYLLFCSHVVAATWRTSNWVCSYLLEQLWLSISAESDVFIGRSNDHVTFQLIDNACTCWFGCCCGWVVDITTIDGELIWWLLFTILDWIKTRKERARIKWKCSRQCEERLIHRFLSPDCRWFM